MNKNKGILLVCAVVVFMFSALPALGVKVEPYTHQSYTIDENLYTFSRQSDTLISVIYFVFFIFIIL